MSFFEANITGEDNRNNTGGALHFALKSFPKTPKQSLVWG